MHEEDHRELESLGLVDRENTNGRRLDFGLLDRGVIARVDERVQMLDELPHRAIPKCLRDRLDLPEELRDVLVLGLFANRAWIENAGEPAGVLQQLVDED